jgi:membrane protease YdiL (CAAX protease family)
MIFSGIETDESVADGQVSASPVIWPPRRGFAWTVGTGVAIHALSAYLACLVSSFVVMLTGTLVIPENAQHFLAESSSSQWLIQTSLFNCLTIFMIYITIWDLGFSSRSYFETKPVSFRRLIRMILVLTAIVLVLSIAYVLLSHLLGDAMSESRAEIAKRHELLSAFPIVGLLVYVFLIPTAEEIFFRGFLYTGIAGSIAGPYVAIVLTASLWAGTHWQYKPLQIAWLFLLGLFLGWNRKKTRSLVSPIIFHALNNFFVLVPFVLRH